LLGLEYSEAALEFCRVRKLDVKQFDIASDKAPPGTYDLVTSFEVAEHLAPWHANRYLRLLCAMSGNIVMSAAVPRQGGTDHVNEQPHSYWIKKFHNCCYAYDEVQAQKFRKEWDGKTASWYSQNVMVFNRLDRQ
jgi:cyclopropane fatty-acyl-phospholipid synthase-like methyltransferase